MDHIKHLCGVRKATASFVTARAEGISCETQSLNAPLFTVPPFSGDPGKVILLTTKELTVYPPHLRPFE